MRIEFAKPWVNIMKKPGTGLSGCAKRYLLLPVAGLMMVLLGAGLQVTPVIADSSSRQWEDDDNSYDQARRALSRGDVLPIEEILKRVNSEIPGQVLEVEFEHERDRWVYEIKLIDEQGRRLEVYLDAQNGEVLSVEGR